ncbi:hypothetical protein [Demequina sp.]|uniref:hypothetical protein n=1 Tax=Demequina sp. TaxID=2050685 RepID=UPI003A8548E0
MPLLALAIVAFAPGVAHADMRDGDAYASSASPQVTTGYGSTASSYGSWYMKDSATGNFTGQIESVKYKLTQGDNHHFYMRLNTSALDYRTLSERSGERRTAGTTAKQSAWTNVSSKAIVLPHTGSGFPTAGSDRYVVTVNTCLDIPLRPDTCTGKSLGRTW